MKKLVIEVGRDDDEAKQLVKDITFGATKDPVRLHALPRTFLQPSWELL